MCVYEGGVWVYCHWTQDEQPLPFSIFIYADDIHVAQRRRFSSPQSAQSFPSVLWHCWLGDSKGIRPVKKVWCWFAGSDDLTGDLHILLAPVVNTTSIILSFQQNPEWMHSGTGLPRSTWQLKWKRDTGKKGKTGRLQSNSVRSNPVKLALTHKPTNQHPACYRLPFLSPNQQYHSIDGRTFLIGLN